MSMNRRRLAYVAFTIIFIGGLFTALAQGIQHVVQSGDVLDLIALEYDVSLDCLVRNNNLQTPSLIYPGEVLTIPQDCPSYNGMSYIPGISDQRERQYGGLGVGGPVTVSLGSSLAARTTCLYDPIWQREFTGPVYTVQQFDMLDFIACDLDVDTMCLAQANNLANPGYLSIGQTLRIDVSCPGWTDPTLPPGSAADIQ